MTILRHETGTMFRNVVPLELCLYTTKNEIMVKVRSLTHVQLAADSKGRQVCFKRHKGTHFCLQF